VAPYPTFTTLFSANQSALVVVVVVVVAAVEVVVLYSHAIEEVSPVVL
jgi:hypothetical protein